MKPQTYFNLLLLTFILVIATGCSYDFDYRISNSVFIEDDEKPGLPIYSEKGYNSFGVYWGLTPFSTARPHDQSIIMVRNDSCHIRFSGSTGQATYTLQVSFPEYTPHSFTDLLSLQDREFDLTESKCVISLFSGRHPLDLETKEGSFTVKKAQNMYIDKELQSVVLSGVFSFKANIDGIPATFSNGRFDMQFGEENFFYQQETE